MCVCVCFLGACGNQSEREIQSAKTELRSTITSDSSALSAQVEGTHPIQVLPNQRTVENHRLPVQSHGPYDDIAAAIDADTAAHDERSGNEERDGKFEHQQNDERNARNKRDDYVVLLRRRTKERRQSENCVEN